MHDRIPSREAQRAWAHARNDSLRHADTTPGNVVGDTVDGVRGYSVGAESPRLCARLDHAEHRRQPTAVLVVLRRLWRGWSEVLVFVKPETVGPGPALHLPARSPARCFAVHRASTGSGVRECTFSIGAIERYLHRLSGPLDPGAESHKA